MVKTVVCNIIFPLLTCGDDWVKTLKHQDMSGTGDMPHPKKKPRLVGPAASSSIVAASLPPRRSRRIAAKPNGTLAQADVVVEIIFGYLPPQDTMRLRLVCQKWRDAAKKTIIPIPSNKFQVNTAERYNALLAMATAMPNLAQISLCNFDRPLIYSDGEDPDQRRALRTALEYHTVDFPETMSSFRMLRNLELNHAPLNGRYPFLFNFPFLEKLEIIECKYLKWDLEMLREMPLLRVLSVGRNGEVMTGNIASLRALKDTLEEVWICGCPNVVGSFMELADFPRLKRLNLCGTSVTGDIRDIREHDFSVLKGYLDLPKTVVGGDYYKFQRISEVSELVNAIDRIRRQHDVKMFNSYSWSLSNNSPDMYFMDNLDSFDYPPPPFSAQFVEAGPRVGWCWRNEHHDCCEINWLDPEPDRDSSDYEKYIEELQDIEFDIDIFRGYHQPPTQEEYMYLCASIGNN